MAQLTSNQTLSGAAYVQIANAAQKFMMTAHSGHVEYFYKATQPSNTDIGHWLREGKTYGDAAPTEKLWARGKDGLAATIVLTKD